MVDNTTVSDSIVVLVAILQSRCLHYNQDTYTTIKIPIDYHQYTHTIIKIPTQ